MADTTPIEVGQLWDWKRATGGVLPRRVRVTEIAVQDWTERWLPSGQARRLQRRWITYRLPDSDKEQRLSTTAFRREYRRAKESE